MPTKFIFHIYLVLFILFSACKATQSAQNNSSLPYQQHNSILDKIIETKTIRIGTTGDFMPFSYYPDRARNTLSGIDIELAHDLAESLNAKIEFVSTTWTDLLSDLDEGKFDIGMSGITIKLNRQQKGLFSIPLLSSGKAAITRDENVDNYSSIESINKKGVRVIVNPGGTNESFARANFPLATIVENEDNLSIFQKIVDGHADLMVTDAIETLIQEQIHPELEAVNPEHPFNFFEMGYLLPRDHTLKAYVDQWLNLIKKDGTFDKIFNTQLEEIKKQAQEKM